MQFDDGWALGLVCRLRDQSMLELRVVESRYRSHQCTCRPGYIRVTSIGADRLAAHLIVVELYLEGFLNITNRASRPNVEVIGTRLHHRKIVRRKKLLHCLRFSRRWREARSDVVRSSYSPAERQDVSVNNRLRRELATALAALKLVSSDRAIRFAAAKEVLDSQPPLRGWCRASAARRLPAVP